MSSNKIHYSAFITSLSLHLVVLLCFIIIFQHKLKDPSPIVQNNPEISAYLYQAAPVIVESSKEMKALALDSERAVQRTKNLPKTEQIALRSSTSTPPVTRSVPRTEPVATPAKINELIAYLHSAIQAKQFYPPAALQMEREGRVTVGFILHKNGAIADLRVVRGSGTASLDEAALQAVKIAAPFTKAEQFLDEAHEYRLDVVFELTS